MRISDWSSDVCSSDLRRSEALDAPALPRAAARLSLLPQRAHRPSLHLAGDRASHAGRKAGPQIRLGAVQASASRVAGKARRAAQAVLGDPRMRAMLDQRSGRDHRSEEHTSELQSLMRISYAVFCLKKKKTNTQSLQTHKTNHTT